MATIDGHINSLMAEAHQDRLKMSLDELEHRHERVLLEWERLATMEKESPLIIKSSKGLPKQLPKLATLNDANDRELPEEATGEQVEYMLCRCRMEEVMVRALEHTLERQTRKLESERSQKQQLQQQLQTILHEKEECQKLVHETKVHFQRVAPLIENIGRRLEDNAEKMQAIEEDVMKIRRDAVKIKQVHQVRYEVERQVDTLSSSITALENQKATALKKMKDSQEEELKLYLTMRAAITKICAQHSESILALDGRYEDLWSNVDQLLDYSNKLLQLTRPEVEALMVGTYHQGMPSVAQLNAVSSQDVTSGSKPKVTSTSAQPDVQASDSQAALQEDIQNGVSSESQYFGTHDGVQLACVDTGVGNTGRASYGHITAEESARYSPTADEQINEIANAKLNLSLEHQNVSEPVKYYTQELLVMKPSVDLAAVKKVNSVRNSFPLLNNTHPTIIDHQNDQTMADKIFVSQGCNTPVISTSSSDISMSGRSLISMLPPIHTLSFCEVECVTINEPTFPLLQNENNGNKDTVLLIEITEEKEFNRCPNHSESTPFVATKLKSTIIAAADSPVGGHLPHNTVIIVREGKFSQTSSLVANSLKND